VIGLCGEEYLKFQGKPIKKLGMLVMDMDAYHADVEKLKSD